MNIIQNLELSKRFNALDPDSASANYNDIHENALQCVLEEYQDASHLYDDEDGFTDPEFGEEMNARHAELVSEAIDAIEEELNAEPENVHIDKGNYRTGDTLQFDFAGQHHTVTGEFYVAGDGIMHHSLELPNTGREVDVAAIYDRDRAEAAGVEEVPVYATGGGWVANIGGRTKQFPFGTTMRQVREQIEAEGSNLIACF